MRIAVCLSGQMRSYEDCWGHLHKHILNQNICDLFISTWDCLGYDNHLNPSDPQQVIYSTESYNLVKAEDLLKRYAPYVRMIRIDSLTDFNRKYVDHKSLHRIERNMYGMYYKIKDCFELMKEYEAAISKSQGVPFQYDYVMRVRSDLFFLKDLPLRPETWAYRDTHYAIPLSPRFGGMNDQMGVGRRNIMEKVCSLWDSLEDYMSQGLNVVRCAESLLKTHLEHINVPCQFDGHPSQDMRYILMRMHHPLEGK